MTRLNRRDLVQVGVLGAAGLTLPQLLHLEAAARPARPKACIFVFPWGGPHHLDTFDPKPDAPAEVRGPYGTIATSVPGIRLVDQFPRLAKAAKLYALVRAISHDVGDHNAAAYLTLTGRLPANTKAALVPATPTDFPALGAVLAKLQPGTGLIPPYVLAPSVPMNLAVRTPGVQAGFLGAAAAPFVVDRDPNAKDFAVPALALPSGVNEARLAGRRALQAEVDQRFGRSEPALAARQLDSHYERAFALVSSPQAKQAFAIDQEPATVRERYGRHTLGQSLLLARRLIEAGVRLVLVNDADPKGDVFRWDTHNADGVAPALRRNLPETDQGLSALLEDLQERGLLESTLVVWMGEMGRTPKERTGHWTKCYPALLAGAGIRGGQVYGASDRIGAFPKDGQCSPADIHATIHHVLGVPGDAVLADPIGREIPLHAGEVLRQLV